MRESLIATKSLELANQMFPCIGDREGYQLKYQHKFNTENGYFVTLYNDEILIGFSTDKEVSYLSIVKVHMSGDVGRGDLDATVQAVNFFLKNLANTLFVLESKDGSVEGRAEDSEGRVVRTFTRNELGILTLLGSCVFSSPSALTVLEYYVKSFNIS